MCNSNSWAATGHSRILGTSLGQHADRQTDVMPETELRALHLELQAAEGDWVPPWCGPILEHMRPQNPLP